MRRPWGLYELCKLRSHIIRRGLEYNAADTMVSSAVASWLRVCDAKASLGATANAQRNPPHVTLLIRDHVPGAHAAWVGYLFAKPHSAELTHLTTLIALHAATHDIDIVAAAAQIAPAMVAGSNARACLLGATSAQGMREYLDWLQALATSPAAVVHDGFLSPPLTRTVVERRL